MTKRNSQKVQMLIDAGLIKPDIVKLIEITGLSKRMIYYWILEDVNGLVSNKTSQKIEQKINDYIKNKENVIEIDDKAQKKISDALGF